MITTHERRPEAANVDQLGGTILSDATAGNRDSAGRAYAIWLEPLRAIQRVHAVTDSSPVPAGYWRATARIRAAMRREDRVARAEAAA